jgi:hypothetical protein
MADNIKPNSLADLLMGARNAIPENKGFPSEKTYGPFGEEYAVDYVPKGLSLANMLRDGLGTAAGWMDWRNKLSPDDYAPQDTLAPLGLGLMGGAIPRGALGANSIRRQERAMPTSAYNKLLAEMNAAKSHDDIQPIWSRRDPSLTQEEVKELGEVFYQRNRDLLHARMAAAKAEAQSTLGPPAKGQEYKLYHGAIDDYGGKPDDWRWFTTDSEHARGFGELTERMAAFQNPAHLDVKDMDVPVGRSGDDWMYERANDLFSKGHDAVFVRNWEGDGMVVLTRDALD